MEKANFNDPLFHLNLSGFNPLNANKYAKIRQTITLVVYLTGFALNLMELIINFQGLDTFSRSSEMLFPEYQFVWKISVLVLFRHRLEKLLDSSRKFWDLLDLGQNHKEKFYFTHRITTKSFLIYRVFLLISVAQFVVQPLLINFEKPIFMCYGEQAENGFAKQYALHVYIFQLFYLFFTANVVLGFDGLFFYFVGHILCELQMIKDAFENVNIYRKKWNDKERFKETIQHHSFVLDFIKEINNCYSLLFINQHFTCLFGICFGIFLIAKDGTPPDSDHISRYAPYIIAFVIQIFTFCMAGHLIIDWSLEISNEIFYDHFRGENFLENYNGKIIAIKRAQREAKLTIGSFADLDLDSFTLVMRNAVSFYTFMNTIYED